MTSWHSEYFAALQQRDRKEKANLEIYNAYAKLADRASGRISPAKSKSTSVDVSTPEAQGRKLRGPNVAPQASAAEALAKARQDLSEAQRSRSVMQSRLDSISDELQTLKLQSQRDSKRIRELTSEKAALSIRMKDQNEELKGKAKLLEDVHDENLSLTLQLNMAEEKSQNLQKENKELVDRWMARMGKEAEDMNLTSKYS